MQSEENEQGIRRRADLVSAVVLVIIGLLIFYLSYEMPRLEARRIHPSTIPGLVPMILGAALAALGLALGIGAWRAEAAGNWSDFFRIFRTRAAARVGAGLGLVLIYALGLVGLMPFWAASMLFIFVFIITMEVFLAVEPVPLLRSALWALITAVVCGGGIYYLFAVLFLVRLP